MVRERGRGQRAREKGGKPENRIGAKKTEGENHHCRKTPWDSFGKRALGIRPQGGEKKRGKATPLEGDVLQGTRAAAARRR